MLGTEYASYCSEERNATAHAVETIAKLCIIVTMKIRRKLPCKPPLIPCSLAKTKQTLQLLSEGLLFHWLRRFYNWM